MNISQWLKINRCPIERGIRKNGLFEQTYRKGWWEKRFCIELNSPDGNSGRTLKFITCPKNNAFKGVKLLSWHKGERPKLERFMTKRGVWPSW